MKIKGSVADKVTGEKIDGAEVVITIDGIPFFRGNTVEGGHFSKTSSDEFGECTITCRVSAQGYQSWENSYQGSNESLDIDALLNPDSVTVNIQTTNKKKQVLSGADITIEYNQTVVGQGKTDDFGNCSVILDNNLREKNLTFKINMEGYFLGTGEFTPAQIQNLAIKLQPLKEKKIIFIILRWIVGAVLAFIGLIIFQKTPVSLLFFIAAIAVVFGESIFNKIKKIIKNRKKTRMVAVVVAKQQNSTASDNAYIIIKNQAGERMDLNISVEDMKKLRIGDTVEFDTPGKRNEVKNIRSIYSDK